MRKQPCNLFACSREYWSMAERLSQPSKGVKKDTGSGLLLGKTLRNERIMTVSYMF